MKVFELFFKVNKNQIIDFIKKEKIDNELYKYRPDLKQNLIKKYEFLFDKIQKINEFRLDTNQYIMVVKELNELYNDFKESEKEYIYNSYMFKENEINIEDLNSDKPFNLYDICFMKWSEILSLNICPLTLKKLSFSEILGQIIFNMTFFGDESSIEKTKNDLIESINYIEDNKDNIEYYSCDEVFDNLRLKYNIKKEEQKEINYSILEDIINKNQILKKQHILSIFERNEE